MKEVWKDIPGYEGLYQINNYGIVKSLDRYVKHSKGGPRLIKGKIISSKIDNGYSRVKLCKDDSKKYYTVHRLVALTFINNPHGLPVVNHIDGNKLNNHVSNLEWCTVSKNTQHAYDTGLCDEARIKISESRKKPVKCITTGEEFGSIKEAAEYYGIDNSVVITYCCKGKTKSAGRLNGKKLCWEYI